MREPIVVTELDYQRLQNCLFKLREARAEDWRHVRRLEAELERAIVVGPDEVPRAVVTMNSELELEYLDTNQREGFRLVYPEDADVEYGRLSVLSPLGTALIGCRSGDEIAWESPRGARAARIGRILFQPEAVGQYQL